MSLTETKPDGLSDPERPDRSDPNRPDPDRTGIGLPLPAGSGARAIRRRRKRQEQRQRRLVALAFIVALAGSAVLIGAPHVGRRIAGIEGARPAPAPAAVDPKVLLAHRHPDGSARSMTIFSDGEDQSSIVMLPAGTMAEVPSLGLEPLGRALEVGGPTRLGSTVENLLGIDLSEVVVVDDADLVALATPVAPLSVEVAARVEQVADDGTVDILYEPGRLSLTAEEIPAFLTAKGRDTDLAMLARHQSFWDSLLGRLAEPGSPELGGPPAVAEVLEGLALDEGVRARLLPVEPLGQADTLGLGTTAGELYQVSSKELERFLASTYPGAEAPADRPQAQVLNGTGGVEVTAHAAERLVPAGIRVALTGNAPRFDYKVTQIVFYDEEQEDIAREAQEALGVGRLVLSRRPLDVVDVTIIIGADFNSEGGGVSEAPAPEPTRRRT